MLWVGEGRCDSKSEGWQSGTRARKEGREMGDMGFVLVLKVKRDG